MPFGFLTFVLGSVLTAPLVSWVLTLAMSNRHLALVPGIGPGLSGRVAAIGLLLVGVCLTLVLGFGLTNHRSAERNPWQILRQLAALTGGLAVAVAAWLAVTLT